MLKSVEIFYPFTIMVKILVHGTYCLFLVERNAVAYSGFNMGAGENAVVSILLDLLCAGPGTLMVIDEIELGLHAKAQKEFIQILKEICKANKCQVICSTHSDIILNALPPEGRFFIQQQSNQTNVIPEISAEYAFGKLAGQDSNELDVFVEDEVSKEIIRNIVPMRIRERIQIYDIGSDQAVLKQMAARYREGKSNFIAFLDGDKRQSYDQQIQQIKRHLETRIDNDEEFLEVIRPRLCYIPGDEWPELSMIKYVLAVDDKQGLATSWDIAVDEVTSYLEQAITAGKHQEFYSLSKSISLIENGVRNDCIRFFKQVYTDECKDICDKLELVLQNL